ncbi:Protein F47F2.3 [Aphelenchoides avenae]|nr:Protein F47F2.3 [Aphelenchus avenae]
MVGKMHSRKPSLDFFGPACVNESVPAEHNDTRRNHGGGARGFVVFGGGDAQRRWAIPPPPPVLPPQPVFPPFIPPPFGGGPFGGGCVSQCLPSCSPGCVGAYLVTVRKLCPPSCAPACLPSCTGAPPLVLPCGNPCSCLPGYSPCADGICCLRYKNMAKRYWKHPRNQGREKSLAADPPQSRLNNEVEMMIEKVAWDEDEVTDSPTIATILREFRDDPGNGTISADRKNEAPPQRHLEMINLPKVAGDLDDTRHKQEKPLHDSNNFS